MTAKSKKGDYYTVSEAARILDVSPSTVWRWIEADKLPAYRVGPRAIRIKKQDLAAVVQPARAKRAPIDRERILFQPVSPEELARRQALVAQILEKRKERSIAPLTTADLVHKAREDEMRSYDSGD